VCVAVAATAAEAVEISPLTPNAHVLRGAATAPPLVWIGASGSLVAFYA